MNTEITYNHVGSWSDALLAHGRYGFALSELKEKNHKLSDAATKLALQRLTKKGKLLSIFKGYYLIIPPQYAAKGILTACDLIQFEKRVGGMNRASTVLNELADVIRPSGFNPILLKHVHVTTLQRLGYLLENVSLNQGLADALYDLYIALTQKPDLDLDDFLDDTTAKLRPDISYSPQEAFELVKTILIARI
ncbi:MAG: hypothetical protein EOM23_06095 [Candidatus Moranbacteria bacterium]|nr:hypothetical protein [Candidatus Moranbacteria bacterium]